MKQNVDILTKCVPMGPIDNKYALVHRLASNRGTEDMALPETNDDQNTGRHVVPSPPHDMGEEWF